MLRFDRSKNPLPAFSLDRRDIAQNRGLKRREWRLIVTLPIAVLLIAVFMHIFNGYRGMINANPGEPVFTERSLPALPAPRLGDSAALPGAAEVAKLKPVLHELQADQAIIRHGDEIDALTLAWADELMAADRAAPPIPQRAEARDLLLGGVPLGGAVTVHGRLLDSVAAPEAGGVSEAGSTQGWQRLVIGLDEQQWAQVLAPASASSLVIGRPITLVGRYLGSALTATDPAGATGPASATSAAGAPATSGQTAVPLLVARSVTLDERSGADSDPDDEIHRAFPATLPPDLFAGITDERMVLESRAYYYLLGQTRIDSTEPTAYDRADNGNARADSIHQNPDDFRDRPFTVAGYVYKAWEDKAVARDQPFGVARAARVLVWSRDFGAVTEIVDGKKVLKTQILRLYEFCIGGDQPLPNRGDNIEIQGRFMKFRAIPVDANSLRDSHNGITRQSDNVYTFVFVAHGYRLIPPPPAHEFGSYDILFGGFALSLIVLLFLVRRRDAQLEGKIAAQIRKFRQTRRQVVKPTALTPALAGPAGAAVGTDAAAAVAPPTGSATVATPDATAPDATAPDASAPGHATGPTTSASTEPPAP